MPELYSQKVKIDFRVTVKTLRFKCVVQVQSLVGNEDPHDTGVA